MTEPKGPISTHPWMAPFCSCTIVRFLIPQTTRRDSHRLPNVLRNGHMEDELVPRRYTHQILDLGHTLLRNFLRDIRGLSVVIFPDVSPSGTSGLGSERSKFDFERLRPMGVALGHATVEDVATCAHPFLSLSTVYAILSAITSCIMATTADGLNLRATGRARVRRVYHTTTFILHARDCTARAPLARMEPARHSRCLALAWRQPLLSLCLWAHRWLSKGSV